MTLRHISPRIGLLVAGGCFISAHVRADDFLDSPSPVAKTMIRDRLTLNPAETIIYAAEQAVNTKAGSEAIVAAGPGADSATLAKKLSNPVASLISVPFQFNYDDGIGPKDAYKLTLNIQPVIPITLNEDWNLIIRTIIPLVYSDSPATGIDSKFGMGDTVQSFFLSPSKGDIVWGIGPVFLWPTATDDRLGSEKWGAGPTGLILKQDHGFTYGILANHIWSYAGENDRSSVNATFVQPFLSYSWPTATTLTFNTEATYDWTDSQWSVPLNVSVGQIVRIGKLPVQFTVGLRYYAEGPTDGPEWGARFVMTFLFPK